MIPIDLFPAKTAPVIDRPLIAYAFLAQATHIQGDLISGLVPIFKPIVKLHSGKDFDSNQFSKQVSELYGIKIHPWAVDDLAPRLEKAGLLERVNITPTSSKYIYSDVKDEFGSVSEDEIRRIVTKFTEFASPLLAAHDIDASADQLEKAFFDQLVNLDFHAVLIKPSKETDVTKSGTTLSIKKSENEIRTALSLNERARLDVLCAAFILDIFDSDKDLYNLVVKVATGALLSEVVLNIQDPGKTSSFLTLKIVLDAPFLMSLLNLSGLDSHRYATELAEILRSNGAVFEVFRHSIDEIRSNLKAVKSGVAAGTGYGATARRLRQPAFAAYVDSVIITIEDLVKRNKIRIIDPPRSTSSYQYFSEEDERSYYRSLGFFQHQIAQSRDAASIAGVMRLRKGATSRMSALTQSQYLFVTENPYIVETAKDFVVGRKMIRPDETPPAVTDRYLAGLAWVLFGGKASQITQYQLLANCTAALEVRSDVQAKMCRFLGEIDETMASQFRAIMTTERGSQHLMQITLGDAGLIKSSDDAEKILLDLENTLAEKHRLASELAIAQVEEAAAAKLKEVSDSSARSVEESERGRLAAEHQAFEASTAILRSESERAAMESALIKITGELEANRKREDTERLERLRTLVAKVARSNKITKFLFITLFSLLSGAIAIWTTSIADSGGILGPYIVFGIISALAAIGFWNMPDAIFRTLVFKPSKLRLALLIDKANLTRFSHDYIIDVEANSVVAKKPSQY